ncbi:hypothetical protein GOP47_0024405 [Adiantum capillus-veneris]|uniref:Proton pump-interactor 1 n=1 Tax=Adiantum capillus-veneris TaxID=13818 RepID=A0A9D4U2Y5_ADICA|nr:hypothetical protein GOP47_0024405 [Adiantum capillus-veneris]
MDSKAVAAFDPAMDNLMLEEKSMTSNGADAESLQRKISGCDDSLHGNSEYAVPTIADKLFDPLRPVDTISNSHVMESSPVDESNTILNGTIDSSCAENGAMDTHIDVSADINGLILNMAPCEELEQNDVLQAGLNINHDAEDHDYDISQGENAASSINATPLLISDGDDVEDNESLHEDTECAVPRADQSCDFSYVDTINNSHAVESLPDVDVNTALYENVNGCKLVADGASFIFVSNMQCKELGRNDVSQAWSEVIDDVEDDRFKKSSWSDITDDVEDRRLKKSSCVQIDAAGDDDHHDSQLIAGEGHNDAGVDVGGVEENAENSMHASGSNTSSDHKKEIEKALVKRHSFYIVRIPKPADDHTLKNEIILAEAKLSEAVKMRDDFQKEWKERKAIKAELFERAKPIRAKERALRDEIQGRRAELEPHLQTTLKKPKNQKGTSRICSSEAELDTKIAEIQHTIQHETIPLKEEKELLREIKRLELTRAEVCANSMLQVTMNNDEESPPPKETRSRVEVLRKDIDSLRKDHKHARFECDELDKELDEVIEQVKELGEQLNAANILQQNSYLALRKLQRKERSRYDAFYKHVREADAMRGLAAQKKVEEVRHFCTKKVEDFMDVWSKDAVFRANYIKSIELRDLQRQTRRSGTSDGRSLGEGESPAEKNASVEGLAMESVVDAMLMPVDIGRVTAQEPPELVEIDMLGGKKEEAAATSSLMGKTNLNADQDVHAEGKLLEDENSMPKCRGKEKNQRKPAKGSTTSTPFNMEDAEIIAPHNQDAQDAELIAKIRKEQTAKAKAAEERKKRSAERAELKAQLRAKKEAESKEREREKKAVACNADLFELAAPAEMGQASASMVSENLVALVNGVEVVLNKPQKRSAGTKKGKKRAARQPIMPLQHRPASARYYGPFPLAFAVFVVVLLAIWLFFH